MRALLQFAPEQSPVHRARIGYAFRIFCSIYDHEPVLEPSAGDPADVCITYCPRSAPPELPAVALSNLYRPRSTQEPPPPPGTIRLEERTAVLRFAAPPGATPDWLAEAFEWISCADEYSVTTRDPVGRVPFSATYFARYNVDPKIPYASCAFEELQNLVSRAARRPTGRALLAPSQSIINTHDIDYLSASYLLNLKHLCKNAAVSFYYHHRPLLAMRQIQMAWNMVLGGPNPLNQMHSLVETERERDLPATYFVIVRRLHRRDGNYDIHDAPVLELLKNLQDLGMEIALHGSYTSNETRQGLKEEFQVLERLGFCSHGNRQHWVRFTLDRLIPSLEYADAAYDSSIGWSDQIGFRAGASFAFPPYNFAEERAARFLEIPLAIMDHSLLRIPGGEDAQFAELSRLLATSRAFPCGALSILWHPTAFGGAQLPVQAGNLFWGLAEKRHEWNDTWMSAATLVRIAGERYSKVGLNLNSVGRFTGAGSPCPQLQCY